MRPPVRKYVDHVELQVASVRHEKMSKLFFKISAPKQQMDASHTKTQKHAACKCDLHLTGIDMKYVVYDMLK